MTGSARRRLLTALLVAVSLLPACRQQGQSASPAAQASGETVYAASFADLDGKMQSLAQWRGKVLVLNFWAPWCPPCRDEIPGFIQLQERYRSQGLIFVGLSLDLKESVRAFAAETGINYPLLLGADDAIALAQSLGNASGGLPFTVVLDRQGKIAATQIGGLTQARLEEFLKPLLQAN